jgi:hypothetical protein
MNKHSRKPLRLDRTTIRSLTKRELSSIAGAFRIGTIDGSPKSDKVIGCPPPQSLLVACISQQDDNCTPGTVNAGCTTSILG